MGRFAAARTLDEDTMAREQRLRGDDHPDTLASAHYLALDLRHLGEVEAARHLDRDTFGAAAGSSDTTIPAPWPLQVASRSTCGSWVMAAARDLAQDTFNRRRQVLGEDHPETLDTANNLAVSTAGWASLRSPAT